MTFRIGVLGGGAWGTALAHLLASQGHDVRLWAREDEVVRSIQARHENGLFLPGIELDPGLDATGSLPEACREKDLLVSVVPAQFVRSILREAAPAIDANVPLVCASKGIETSTLKLLHEVFEEILPGSLERRLCFLSGPNFASEIAQGLPGAATLAGLNEAVASEVQKKISTPLYKISLSSDVVGVEVGGAVKNVVAIAAGIVDGLDRGLSLRASAMTKGLGEMSRLGTALGADPLTFAGLSGLGDLVLTCLGDLSRNRTLGLELANGRTLEEITGGRKTVAEGAATAEAVHKLAEKHGLDLPLCEGVYQILYRQKPCLEAIQAFI